MSAAAANGLDQLAQMTVIVADTGEIEQIRKYKPSDATTNPSLILKAVQLAEYGAILDDAIAAGVADAAAAGKTGDDRLPLIIDHLTVKIGVQILGIVPGLVSTEVDARLSYDTEASVAKAHHLIALYEKAGIARERILIKLASTWEGIRAAEQLEKAGIHCNMTLMFCLAQAAASAEAGATLISPFVGRIYDWHKKALGVDAIAPTEDPGVLSVQQIYTYYKTHGYDTVVMGASFRSLGEILELAGCDKLTIGPKFLEELQAVKPDAVVRKLDPAVKDAALAKLDVSEPAFRWQLGADAMATEKLAEGIRAFAADTVKLEGLIRAKLQ